MSRMTYERALGIVAERTYFNKRDIRQKNVQRRNQVVDLYGVPYYARSNDENEATFYISVSPDMIYYNRFQFRLAVHNAESENFNISIDGEDITIFLKNQHGGDWIEGEGLYPLDQNVTLEEDDIDDFYDILDVAQQMQALADSGDTSKEWETIRAKMLRSGWKKIKMTSDAPFDVTMFLYLKYNHMNR